MMTVAGTRKRWLIKRKAIDFSITRYRYSTSYTERLTKQYIRGKKVESDFEERGQYQANLQEETLVVLEWYEAPVADSEAQISSTTSEIDACK
jgi:hypothetical protein